MMRTSCSVTLALVVSGLFLVPTSGVSQAAPVDSVKAALIRRLLHLTRAAELAVSTMKAAIPAQRAANPRMPAAFWDELAARAEASQERFVDLLLPTYDEYFTPPQLRELIALYSSPLGRHLIDVQPRVAAQTIQAGQQWGSRLGAEIAQDLTHGRLQARPKP